MTGEIGRIASVQTMGTLDGPGIRFVAFLQGCPLRCACCHNPETHAFDAGTEIRADELADRAARYREYFGTDGGITLSGGEPLLQPEFTAAVFRECRDRGIKTCLDTSGYRFDAAVDAVLDGTDFCLLDLKYDTDRQYRTYVGCPISAPLAFLERLNEKNIPTRIRRVVIPGINDTESSARSLAETVRPFPCVTEIEFLPFRKFCEEKYRSLGKVFPFADREEASEETVARLRRAVGDFAR